MYMALKMDVHAFVTGRTSVCNRMYVYFQTEAHPSVAAHQFSFFTSK